MDYGDTIITAIYKGAANATNPPESVDDNDVEDVDEELIGFLFGQTGYYETLCTLYKMVVLGIMILVVSAFGYVGNALTILTMWSSRHTSATSLILIVLAALDSGVCFVWWLNLGIPAICDYARTARCDWYFAYVYQCTNMYIWPVGRWCHYAGTWVVVLVTAHRFVAACYPLKAKSWTTVPRARVQLLVIGICAFVYVIPRCANAYLQRTPDGIIQVRTAFGKDVFWFSTFYESILYLIIIYVIPFPLLTYMTIRLVVSLRKTREKREKMSKTKREEKDLTTTLVIVVVVFMICQLPNPIRRLLVGLLNNEQRACDTFYPYYRSLASFLLVFNSSVNFVIYCLFGERFRKNLVRRLRGILGLHTRVGVEESTATATTHTTQNE